MKRGEETYDIFLSYRRNGGIETAKHIFDLLTRDGYRVSFDIDTLRSGDFDTQLLQRIDQCTDFILILNAGAFDRSIDPTVDRNKDWLRIELAYALEKGKNIIPVMLNGFTEFPDNLPDDIVAVRRKNGPKHDNYYFDAFYDKLLRFLNSTPACRKKELPQQADNDDAILKVESDLACHIYIDGEEWDTVQSGEICRIPLRGGSYRLRFVSTENPADCIEDKKFRIAKDTEEWYSVVLTPIKQKREKQEERRKYLLQLPDSTFTPHEKNGKWGYINNPTGEILIDYQFDEAEDFHEGLASAAQADKWGFIDKTGFAIVPFLYDMTYDAENGTGVIQKGGKQGLIDLSGKEISPCIWDFIYNHSIDEEAIEVENNEKFGFIDRTGEIITPCIWDKNHGFCEGLAAVMNQGKWGFIDKKGEMVIPCIYDDANSFNEGLACVKQGEKYGFLDKKGEMVVPCIYDDAYSFEEGLACVQRGEKYGFIDKKGVEVIPFIYDEAWNFNKGLACIQQEGKWGSIDKNGNMIIPCIYDYAYFFNDGLANVQKEGKQGYIDNKGNWVKDKE